MAHLIPENEKNNTFFLSFIPQIFFFRGKNKTKVTLLSVFSVPQLYSRIFTRPYLSNCMTRIASPNFFYIDFPNSIPHDAEDAVGVFKVKRLPADSSFASYEDTFFTCTQSAQPFSISAIICLAYLVGAQQRLSPKGRFYRNKTQRNKIKIQLLVQGANM